MHLFEQIFTAFIGLLLSVLPGGGTATPVVVDAPSATTTTADLDRDPETSHGLVAFRASLVRLQVRLASDEDSESNAGDENDEEDGDDESDSRDSRVTVVTPTQTKGMSATEPHSAGASIFTVAQVAAHATATSCYSIVNGGVYDLTSFFGQHPGGAGAIKSMCGHDASAAFNGQHGGQARPESELAGFKIGLLAS